VKTNIPLHQALLAVPDVIQQGDYTIKWLEEWLAKQDAEGTA
jgi:acetyl-CoA carboxylase biotin carboxylase subunit